MKLTQIAIAASTYFFAASAFANPFKPPVSAPEPSVLGLLGLGVVIALVATKFKK